MAIQFDNSNGAANTATYCHLELATPVVTAPPFTMFAWINPTSIGAIGSTIITVTRTPVLGFGGSDYNGIAIVADGRVAMACGGPGGTPVIAYGPTTVTLNAWNSVAGVVASYTSNICYLNGIAGTENTNTSQDISAKIDATYVGVSATVNFGVYVAPYIGCCGYAFIWNVALSPAQIALLHAGADPNDVEPGAQVMALDILTVATAGDNSAGSDFTVVDPVNLFVQCPDEPPIEPEPPPPEPPEPGAFGYYIERMDNRIWPTIEQAWCVDSALRYPMPEPDATLSATSATGQQSITEYNLINGGSGYTSPIAQIIDLAGTGSGALCSLGVSSGVIVSATAISIGQDYRAPQVTILDATGVLGVVQPIVTNYVTMSATATGSDWVNFTSSDVGSIIRMGGGKAEVITISSTVSLIANIITPITKTTPNDPYNTPVPAVSGQWSMTAPTMTVSGLDHLEGLNVVALADGGVVPTMTVSDGSVTLPVEATAIVVGLPFVAQLQTMYMDLGGGPTVQTRRKDVTQVVVRVENSLAPEVGLNQPDAAAQPNQAEVPWGVQQFGASTPITAMTQIRFRTPNMPAGQAQNLYSGDLDISAVFSSWDSKGQVAVQQRDCVPLNVTALVSWVKVGDTTGQ